MEFAQELLGEEKAQQSLEVLETLLQKTPAIDFHNKDLLDSYLRYLLQTTPNLTILAQKTGFSLKTPLNALAEIPIEPLYKNSDFGAIVYAIMLSPVGKHVRRYLPQFKAKCNLLPQQVNILSDGSVTTCCLDSMGGNTFASVKDKTFDEIWKEDVSKVVRGDLYDYNYCRQCIGSQSASLITPPEEYRKWQTMVAEDLDSLTIEVMGKCNYACIGCPASKVPDVREATADLELIFKQIESSLPKIKRLRLFNWGEPFLNRDFPEFLKKIRQATPDIIILISTNGMLMKKKIARLLVQERIDQIVVSIHGGASTAKLLMYAQRGADYDKVFNNVKYLIEHRNDQNAEFPKVSLRTILFDWNDNDEDMNQVRREAKKLGLGAHYGNPEYDNYHWILNGGKTSNSKRFTPGSKELEKLIENREFFECSKWGKK